MARGLRVTLTGTASITVPSVLTTAADAGSWVSEGSPIRVRKLNLGGPKLDLFKLAAIRAFSDELRTYAVGDVEAIFRQTLSQAVALALDTKMFSADAAVAGTSPAGLLNGLSPLTAAAAGVDAAMQDIKHLVEALATAGGGVQPVFIAAPGQAAVLKSRMSGSFDYPVLASGALAADTIIAVEGPSFATAFGAVPRFDVSDSAVLHFEDTSPAPLSTGTGPTVATPIRSLFQEHLTAVKMTLPVSYAMRATGHVQFITGVAW
jgi:hypothetical protein